MYIVTSWTCGATVILTKRSTDEASKLYTVTTHAQQTLANISIYYMAIPSFRM